MLDESQLSEESKRLLAEHMAYEVQRKRLQKLGYHRSCFHAMMDTCRIHTNSDPNPSACLELLTEQVDRIEKSIDEGVYIDLPEFHPQWRIIGVNHREDFPLPCP